MAGDGEMLCELITLRVRAEVLEQDLSEAIHLLYSSLLWIAQFPESEFRQRTLAFQRAKIFQLPQGSRLGQELINLDKQFGNRLETHGVNLERWVYEPRGRRHG